jgi:hypothetical protein
MDGAADNDGDWPLTLFILVQWELALTAASRASAFRISLSKHTDGF